MEMLWIGIVLVGAAVVRAMRSSANEVERQKPLVDKNQALSPYPRRWDASAEEINPTTGLPMLLGLPIGNDIGGTPYCGSPGDSSDLWVAPSRDITPDGGHTWGWMRESDEGGWVNPATGLPMAFGGPHGFDVAGNPYGFDNSDDFDSMRSIDTEGYGDGRGAFGLEDDFGSSFGASDFGSGSDWCGSIGSGGMDDHCGGIGGSGIDDYFGSSSGTSSFGGGSDWD